MFIRKGANISQGIIRDQSRARFASGATLLVDTIDDLIIVEMIFKTLIIVETLIIVKTLMIVMAMINDDRCFNNWRLRALEKLPIDVLPD